MNRDNRELIQKRIEKNMKEKRHMRMKSDAKYFHGKYGFEKAKTLMENRYGWQGSLAVALHDKLKTRTILGYLKNK